MISSERAQRLAELVKSAVDLSPADWKPFLDKECGSDDAMRAEIESLLKHQKHVDTFIEQPALHLTAETFVRNGEQCVGQIIGEYEVLSLIGSGGMGDVYLAQDRQLHRKAALKLVRLGIGNEEIMRRFQREEFLLASLNHANIAQLYGSGITAEGMPFFAMEYVEGTRIDQFCNENKLSLHSRLELFRKICGAVHYAHQHLVVHRDIKPSNILVTAEGEPKLLDFGIAKIVDADPTLAVARTVTEMKALTPEYASPEQLKGESVTTATDIYSLGVVLYELLTEQRPYRLKTSRPDELSRVICDEEPTKPSVALANRQQSPSSGKFLKGDLDNIILMAMRKEPSRRYLSVAQFSGDIRRHLEALPVVARQATWRYRTSKAIRRNKVGVLSAALICLALLAGMAATSWQTHVAHLERTRAERRFNDVRKLANSYLFEIHAAIENLPGSTPARQLIVQRALEYLDNLALEEGADLSLQREVVMAYLKAGNVQGNPRDANLGNTEGALNSYRKALAIATKWPVTSGDVATRRPLALIYEKIADVEAETSQLDRAVASARKSLAIFKELAEAHPDSADEQRSVAISHLKTGDVLGNPNYPNLGDQSGAMEHYRAAANVLESLHSRDVANVRTRRFLGMIHERIGTVLESRNDITGALADYKRSAEIRVPLAAEFPNDMPIVRDAAIAYEKIGNVMSATGDREAALENRRKSLEIFRHLLEADPQNILAQRSLAISHVHLGDLLGEVSAVSSELRTEAMQHYRDAIRLFETLKKADPANATTRRDLIEAQAKLGKVSKTE
jgi:non-specific serine/threonine protein kinase/serine/threonine-protein kinase